MVTRVDYRRCNPTGGQPDNQEVGGSADGGPRADAAAGHPWQGERDLRVRDLALTLTELRRVVATGAVA